MPDLLHELFSEEIPACPFARSAVTREDEQTNKILARSAVTREDEQDINGMRGRGNDNA